MPSVDHASTETTLLLGNPQPTPSKERHRISPATLLIPVAIATRLAGVMPTTTLIALVREIVCKLYQTIDQTGLPADPSIDICDAAEVERYFSMAVAVLHITEGILGVVGCGLLSNYSSRFGRKPAICLMIISGILGGSLIVASQSTPDWLSSWLLPVAMLFHLFSCVGTYSFLFNAYVLDTCNADERTTALSRIAGWTLLGNCGALVLGGIITTETGNPLTVFYIESAGYLTTLIYVVFVLPESFSEENRRVLVHMADELPIQVSFAKSLLHTLAPLKLLLPRRNSDGSRNWRLTLCASHLLVVMTSNSYIATAWMVLVTSKYHLTPAQTGLVLATVGISSTVTLTAIVPQLVHFLRPYYNRSRVHSLSPEERPANNVDDLEIETSERLDIHLAFTGWLITGIFCLFAARATTNLQLLLSASFVGMGTMYIPTLRSLVAGSVDPLKQGETLAAIEMVSSVGICLSTIVIGGLLTATITTAPLTIFYINLVAVTLGGGVLFFVRDADRFHKPHQP